MFTPLTRFAAVLPQVGGLLLLWWVGDALVRLVGIALPGSLVGFALLLALLAAGWLPERHIAPGANFVLERMLVLFVPALLAVLDHPEFLGVTGLKILLVIVAGTAVVMAVTAWVACAAIRMLSRDGR